MMDDEKRRLRDTLGNFATGVTVITTTGASGRPVGLTANSFSSLSLEPPLVLWNLGNDSWCYDDFCAAGYFAIHFLSSEQRALSSQFARKSRDKFQGVDWAPGAHDLPIIDDVLAVLICSRETLVDGGDHKIVVGRVESHESRADLDPLLFYRGAYAALSSD